MAIRAVRWAVSATVVGIALAGCGGASAPAGHHPPRVAAPRPIATTSTSAPTAPPVMSESFTRLPCNPATTVGEQGCAERDVSRADAVINRELAFLWRASSGPERGRLVAAQQAWLAYRSAMCASEADAFAGGSQAAVVTAECLARLTRERAAELAKQHSLTP